MESSDDEYGDLNFLTSAGARNQAEFKAKTPIRREVEDSSSSSLDLSDDEDEPQELDIVPVVNSSPTQKTPVTKGGRRRSTRRKKSLNNTSNANGSIVILSDDDLPAPEEEVDEEKIVKVLWKYEIHRIPVPREGKVSDLLKCFSSRVSIASDDIELFLDDKALNPESSLENINVIDIISACQGLIGKTLELKIQDGHSREPTLLKIPESETIQGLLETYLQIKGDSSKKDLSLMFDGEVQSKETSLKDLDLEGGECFDLVVKKVDPLTKSNTPTRRSTRQK